MPATNQFCPTFANSSYSPSPDLAPPNPLSAASSPQHSSLLITPLKPGKAGPVREKLMDTSFLASLSFTLTNKMLSNPDDEQHTEINKKKEPNHIDEMETKEYPESPISESCSSITKDNQETYSQNSKSRIITDVPFWNSKPLSTPECDEYQSDESSTIKRNSQKSHLQDDLDIHDNLKHESNEPKPYLIKSYLLDEDLIISYDKNGTSSSMSRSKSLNTFNSSQNQDFSATKVENDIENFNKPITNNNLQGRVSQHSSRSSFDSETTADSGRFSSNVADSFSSPSSIDSNPRIDSFLCKSFSETIPHFLSLNPPLFSSTKSLFNKEDDSYETYTHSQKTSITSDIEEFEIPEGHMLTNTRQFDILPADNTSSTDDIFTVFDFPPESMPLNNSPLPAKFEASAKIKSFDPITVSFLVQSAIHSAREYEVFSDVELQQKQSEITILKSRLQDLKTKIIMETKIKESATRLANSEIGKWPTWDEINGRGLTTGNQKMGINQPLSVSAFGETLLSGKNIKRLEDELENTKDKISIFERQLQEHRAAILAITHTESGCLGMNERLLNLGDETYGDSNEKKLNIQKISVMEERIDSILAEIYARQPERRSKENSDRKGIEVLQSIVSDLLNNDTVNRGLRQDNQYMMKPTAPLNITAKPGLSSRKKSLTKNEVASEKIQTLENRIRQLEQTNEQLRQKESNAVLGNLSDAASVILLRQQFTKAVNRLKSEQEDVPFSFLDSDWQKTNKPHVNM